jgi:hypothetical protein
MAAPLVGTAATVTVGTSGAAVTTTWGTGQNRTKGNLLVCYAAVGGSATLPGTPTGGGLTWYAASTNSGTTCTACIWLALAAGGDTAPTIPAVTSGIISAQVAEFTSNSPTGYYSYDKNGYGSGTTSPLVNKNTAADTNTSGNIFLYAFSFYYSAAATKTLTSTLNNGMPGTGAETNSAATSTRYHYAFGYGLPTTHAAAAQDSMAFTTTSITGGIGSCLTTQYLVPGYPEPILMMV